MKLVGGGIPVPENLVDFDQFSVDMPPPSCLQPLKQLEQLCPVDPTGTFKHQACHRVSAVQEGSQM